MESTKNKRLRALQTSGAEKIYEAYDWVQEHHNRFKKEVYGPVLIEVYQFRLSYICIFVYYHVHSINYFIIANGGQCYR